MTNRDRNVPTVVYIGHFSRPFGHGKHYRGVSSVPNMRFKNHKKGKSGVPYVRHAVAAGIEIEFFIIAEFNNKDDAYAYEKHIKGRSGTRDCPVCNPKARIRFSLNISTDGEVPVNDEEDQY